MTMKKFKVIEKSRFLNKNAMATIEGGSCIGAIYTICKPATAEGFSTNPSCGATLYGTCDVGWIYKATELCHNTHLVSCGTGTRYFGPIPPPLP